MEADEEMNADEFEDEASKSETSDHLPLHAEQFFEDDYQYDREELTQMKNQLRPKQRKRQEAVCLCCSTKHESRSALFRRNVRRTVHLLNISPRMKALILDR